jgi:sulfopyruvate decarboxylase subunit beta
VLDGDGAVLMNLGTLATIANFAPENYLLVILDNCCYGSTGSQPTCTHMGTDLAFMAKAAGVKEASAVADIDSLQIALESKGVVVAKVETGNADVPVIDISPEQIVRRFRRSFLPALQS